MSMLLTLSMVVGLLPMNRVFSYAEGESDVIEVYTAEDFYNIRDDINANYVLMNDINLNDYSGWSSCSFSGSFDGKGQETYSHRDGRDDGT